MKQQDETETSQAGPAGTHRSLERGLALLEAVAVSPQPLALADAVRCTGLHRSTAHHLLQALVRSGYLRQEESSRAYVLSQKLFQLTGRTWSTEQLGEIARPFLEELTALTGEGCSVAIWIGGQVRIAAKQETEGPVRVVQDMGGDRPLYCTAVGKALAAWLPAAEVAAVLDRTTMVARTPRTITTREAFDAELRRIRSAGYAIDDEEQFEGLRCIAVPVFSHTGQVIASMCVVSPKQRMTQQKLQAVRAPLVAQARRLSERLGHEPATAPKP
ncbi:MAG: IclR family transcriptional regulator [Rubrivivax sp.]|nr:IclR family transcriptional regulator [Rubrivivax sp.]